jgi:hypothetical protein
MDPVERIAMSALALRAAFAEQESKNSTHRAGTSAVGSSGVILTSVGGMVLCGLRKGCEMCSDRRECACTVGLSAICICSERLFALVKVMKQVKGVTYSMKGEYEQSANCV